MPLSCTEHLTHDVPSSDSNQRVNNNGVLRKERDRRYRDKHKEKINQRRRDNRRNLQSLESITNVNSIQPIQHVDASSKQVDKKTLRKERDRNYRERHREEINQRRRENRHRKQNIQHIATASNVRSVDKIQLNTEELPDEQPSANCSNLIVAKESTQNFDNCLQHNTQHSEERQNISFVDTTERTSSSQNNKNISQSAMRIEMETIVNQSDTSDNSIVEQNDRLNQSDIPPIKDEPKFIEIEIEPVALQYTDSCYRTNQQDSSNVRLESAVDNNFDSILHPGIKQELSDNEFTGHHQHLICSSPGQENSESRNPIVDEMNTTTSISTQQHDVVNVKEELPANEELELSQVMFQHMDCYYRPVKEEPLID